MKITKALRQKYFGNSSVRGDHGFTLHNPFHEVKLSDSSEPPENYLGWDAMMVEAGKQGPKFSLTIFQGRRLRRSVNGPLKFWKSVMEFLNSEEGQEAFKVLEEMEFRHNKA